MKRRSILVLSVTMYFDLQSVLLTHSVPFSYLTKSLTENSVVVLLEHRDCDREDSGSKHSRAILLCPWERLTALSPALWWSWQAVLNFSHISIQLKKYQLDSKSWHWQIKFWHLRKQIEVIACPMYSASVTFLRVRRINEI